MHNPFNGDTFIGKEIRKLVRDWSINTIVETGTWSGHSTREFVAMGPRVVTIDSTLEHLTEEFGEGALSELTRLGILVVLGDSSKLLPSVIVTASAPILFYLDAHGGGANDSNVNPLLEELDAIARSLSCRNNCVIVIHDFKVPGKDWGYNGGDWGRGWEPLSYELVLPYLERTYPAGYGYHYNNDADGMRRGVIYVYPV
jgi:hypothetical protein